MLICGIDASSNKTGIAVFCDGEYMGHTLIDLHKIKNPDQRIPKMMVEMCKYIKKHMPDKIIMEKSMMKNNIDTVQKLSNIAGAVMLYAATKNIEFQHVYPSEWRKKIGLSQSSQIKREVLKEEAVQAVKREYGMDVTDDEAESILIARSGFDLPKIEIEVDII
jgi:Holliday junction resolvasome RuvABC endonuclease subunit